MDCDVRLCRRLKLVNKMESLALFWELPVGILYIYCRRSFVILLWPAYLPKISQLLVHNTPDFCLQVLCRVQTLLSWLKPGKKSLSVVQTEIKCVACFVLCNWFWCVCGDTELVLDELLDFFFLNNCMIGEWNIVSLRSCWQSLTVYAWMIVYVFSSPSSRDSGLERRSRICCYYEKGAMTFHICIYRRTGERFGLKSVSPAPSFSLYLDAFICSSCAYFLEHSSV